MTFIIVAGVLSLTAIIWYLIKAKPESQSVKLSCEEDLAPEATPAPALIAEITKKNTAKKKAVAKSSSSKSVSKSKPLTKTEVKPKKKSTKK